MVGVDGGGVTSGGGLPSAVGVEKVFGPGGGDAVFVPPTGFVAGREDVEVGLAGQAGSERVWGAGVCHAAGSSSGRPWAAGGDVDKLVIPDGTGFLAAPLPSVAPLRINIADKALFENSGILLTHHLTEPASRGDEFVLNRLGAGRHHFEIVGQPGVLGAVPLVGLG